MSVNPVEVETVMRSNRKPKRPVGRLLSKGQVAEQLGISTRTVSRLVFARQLPAYAVGRQVRVPAEALEGFLSERRIA